MLAVHERRGFTIVELLIVIVVIAIIAAISIVAYNGIQTRAENTKTIQGVTSYVKAIHSYAATYGNYPVEVNYPCFGSIGTTCARVSGDGSGCLPESGGDGGAAAQTTFDTEIKKVLTKVPVVSSQTMNCNGSFYAGAYYRPSTGSTATVVYFLKGNESCGGVGGIASFTKTQRGEMTRCVASLPSL